MLGGGRKGGKGVFALGAARRGVVQQTHPPKPGSEGLVGREERQGLDLRRSDGQYMYIR